MTVSRSLRSLLVLLLAVGVIVGGGLLTQREVPQVETAAEVVEPIGTSVVLCPEPGIGSDTGVRVTAAVVPGLPGQDTGAGRAALATLPGTPEVSRALTAPGQQVQITGFGRKLPPIEGLGFGALAPGFIADQWSRDPRPQDAGGPRQPGRLRRRRRRHRARSRGHHRRTCRARPGRAAAQPAHRLPRRPRAG